MNNRLKELRESKGLTMQELADIIGTTKATISRQEAGIHIPRIELLIKLADFYECSLDYIYYRTDTKKWSS